MGITFNEKYNYLMNVNSLKLYSKNKKKKKKKMKNLKASCLLFLFYDDVSTFF